MKRIGTIKFYRELDYILNNSHPYIFKESLLITIFDYLTYYELYEIELAMENVKKYFYPEFLHLYNSILKYYPQIVQIFNHFHSSIDIDIKINRYRDEQYLSINESLFSAFEDHSTNKLYSLIVKNVNKKLRRKEFVNSIIIFNSDLDVFANIIYQTMMRFLGQYRHIQAAIKGDIEYFQYTKAYTKCRIFCNHKENKYFHISEIFKMNNKEIDPVLYFGGGLGCNHSFEGDGRYKPGK